MRKSLDTSWWPWRRDKPVRWTLALALALLAAVAAALPTKERTVFVGPVATWAAFLALGIALSTVQWQAAWRGRDPGRNTAAFVLPLLWLAYMLMDSILGGHAGHAHAAWIPAMTGTVLFVSSAVSSRQGWLSRVVWACIAACGWWVWWKAP